MYNPNEPRDAHGRWTSGGISPTDWPLPNPSPVGRARTLLGHGIIGLYPRFTLPTMEEAERFARMLRAWTDASDLDDQSFHHLFMGRHVEPLATTRLLRETETASR